MASMSRRGIVGVVAVAFVMIAAPASEVEREHIGRYSTPEMADLIVYVPAAVAAVPVAAPVVAPLPEPRPVPAAPAAPQAPEPAPLPEVAPLPEPGDLIANDPDAGPYTYDPEQPNEGRGNGAGGWEPEPTPEP